MVGFTGLDTAEQMTITCATACGSSNVTFTGVGATDAANIARAVNTATGSAAVITGYDSAALPSRGRVHSLLGRQRPTTNEAGRHNGRLGRSARPQASRTNGGPQTNGGTPVVTANNSPRGQRRVGQDHPDADAVHPERPATDANGDTLTYLWEQTDIGGATGTGLVDNNKLNGPLFRVFGVSAQVSEPDSLLYNSPGENLAGTDPSRTFPDLPQILVGNTNAASGTCPAPLAAGTIPITDPALNCFSEFLPTTPGSAPGTGCCTSG